MAVKAPYQKTKRSAGRPTMIQQLEDLITEARFKGDQKIAEKYLAAIEYISGVFQDDRQTSQARIASAKFVIERGQDIDLAFNAPEEIKEEPEEKVDYSSLISTKAPSSSKSLDS